MSRPRLIFALGLAVAGWASSVPAAVVPVLTARIQVLQPACSRTEPGQVGAAVAQASRLLQHCCALRLSLAAYTMLPVDTVWCHPPADRAARGEAFARAAGLAKAADPTVLTLVLLPDRTDDRLSWALVDTSPRHGCDSPQETRFLRRFGALFFTDLAFASDWRRGPGDAPTPGLLVAHEVLHALTQRGHPTGAGPGQVMADHLSDLGPQVSPDWCDCARRSPYLRRP